MEGSCLSSLVHTVLFSVIICLQFNGTQRTGTWKQSLPRDTQIILVSMFSQSNAKHVNFLKTQHTTAEAICAKLLREIGKIKINAHFKKKQKKKQQNLIASE